jgi:ABC-type uncharacterized transport system substrate-binding protein
MSSNRETVVAGALVSLSANYAVLYERSAYYVDKIIKGARPADLPVEQPTKLQAVINLKTAHALGLTISPGLARADRRDHRVVATASAVRNQMRGWGSEPEYVESQPTRGTVPAG